MKNFIEVLVIVWYNKQRYGQIEVKKFETYIEDITYSIDKTLHKNIFCGGKENVL